MTGWSTPASQGDNVSTRLTPARLVWGIALLAAIPLTFIPAIDLTVAGWFYDPTIRFFPVQDQAWSQWVLHSLPIWIFAGLALTVTAWGVGALLKRPLLPLSGRAVLFLVLSLALGPGLIVNVALKDHWGRPRPSTVTQFGGVYEYRPPIIPGGPCPHNCSFPSGHASLGFWLVAPAMLAPKRRRRVSVAAALGFGASIGMVRIAQGGHFLSDVLFAGLITVGIIALLYSFLTARQRDM